MSVDSSPPASLSDFKRGDIVRYKPDLENEQGFVHLVTTKFVFVRFYKVNGMSQPQACNPCDLVKEAL